ncbi:MAG TPA: hypothetical protein VKO16_00510 [Polyangia bacterium]|nr:hypothetical protein [Polyangia bacterium]
MRAPLGLAALLAVVASCGNSQVTMLGARQPARPLGCMVQVVPGSPAGAFVDLVSARARCLEGKRGDCLDELRRQACAAGGDIVYGLSESVDQHVTYIAATLALRGQAGSGAPAPHGGAAGPPACTPICSPGFDCQGGRCIPLCNPVCAPSEICNMHRNCEPAAPASVPAAPTVPPA